MYIHQCIYIYNVSIYVNEVFMIKELRAAMNMDFYPAFEPMAKPQMALTLLTTDHEAN